MKKTFLTLCCATALFSASAQVKKANTTKKAATPSKAAVPTPLKLNNTTDSLSYAFGYSVGKSLENGGIKSLKYDVFIEAVKSVLEGKNSLLSDEQVQNALTQAFQKSQEAKFAKERTSNAAFLEQNKQNPNVKITASGLQYEVVKGTEGKKPTADDVVEVHYEGKLIDGTIFDSSIQRGESVSLEINRVIQGWTEGLQLMSEGSKYKFYIPYQLGYGEQGAGPKIPPYSTLVFEVELIKIKEN